MNTEPITFFEALAAMRTGSRVEGEYTVRGVEYRIAHGILERRTPKGWVESRMTVTEALQMRWFRLEVENG